MVKPTNPGLWERAKQTEAPGAAVHGYRTIGDIMQDMNPLAGNLYLEALHMTRVAREAYVVIGGKYPHPETLVPGGVSTTVTLQTFNEIYVRLQQFFDYSKKVVAIWDDLTEFFYEANPAYRQLSTSLLIPDATPEQMRSLNDLMSAATTPDAAIKRLRPYHFVDLRDIARTIQCPTLVFHSRGDTRIPFEQGRALATIIPRARFVALESRNHWVVNTEPAWQHFVSELDSFLPALPQLTEGMPFSTLGELTRRELQVLELIAQGIDNHAIGQRLGIAEKTVRNHVSTVFSKLGCHTRAQAIVWARDAGLIGKPNSA
jgi:DNA-binding CsgD family transcriptional regulator